MKKIITFFIALVVLGGAAIGIRSTFFADEERSSGDSTLSGAAPSASPSSPVLTDAQGSAPGDSAQNNDSHQGEGCSPFYFLAAPGTWESRADDDPVHPQANPASLMLNVTTPLQDPLLQDQLEVWTLPYTAQFRNIGGLNEKTYDESRNEGYQKVWDKLLSTYQHCPESRFILSGFSQGAVLMGDMASTIGNNHGPIPPESVAGVALIADGRQTRTDGIMVGAQGLTGVGAEVALQDYGTLTQAVIPGASLRGERAGGFGSLQDRTMTFCARGDLVCDAPENVKVGVQRIGDFFGRNEIHAQYASNLDVIPGETVPDWIVRWARDMIQS